MQLLGENLIYNIATGSVCTLYTETTISVLAQFADFQHMNEMPLSARI